MGLLWPRRICKPTRGGVRHVQPLQNAWRRARFTSWDAQGWNATKRVLHTHYTQVCIEKRDKKAQNARQMHNVMKPEP